MGAGTDGRVAPLDISNLIKDALDSNIEFDTLSAARASLKNVEASVVETDSLKLPNLRKTLLSTDSTGLVVAAEDVSVGTLMAVTASVKELTVSSLTLKVLARKGPTTSILSVSSDGVVEIVDDISIKKLSVMESKMEKLVVNALEVAGAVDVRAIAAKELKVTGQSQFHDDIFVRGSVSVEGSVIGSGPYVDSSDRRFKTNVVQMTDALDKLCSMQAVSSPRRIEALQSMTNITQVYFDYDAEGFPSRNFPTERQVGWMADEVKENFPELVVEDVSGFQSVAYARSTAVIAEAVKELRRETDDKLSKILEELVSIRNEISDIKEKMKGGVR
jgi:predicted Mrr-cat superfamily restriction endonuclease